MLRARPPVPVLLLMAVGLSDLVLTAVLYEAGLIVELNPLMRPLIQSSTLLFVAVKLATLVVAYVGLQVYGRIEPIFVRRAAWIGTFAYVALWIGWVAGAHLG